MNKIVKCPKCGNLTAIAGKTCPVCGSMVAEDFEHPVGENVVKENHEVKIDKTEPHEDLQEKKRIDKKRLSQIALLALFLVLLLLLVYCCKTGILSYNNKRLSDYEIADGLYLNMNYTDTKEWINSNFTDSTINSFDRLSYEEDDVFIEYEEVIVDTNIDLHYNSEHEYYYTYNYNKNMPKGIDRIYCYFVGEDVSLLKCICFSMDKSMSYEEILAEFYFEKCDFYDTDVSSVPIDFRTGDYIMHTAIDNINVFICLDYGLGYGSYYNVIFIFQDYDLAGLL